MRDGTATETHKENGSATNNKQKAVMVDVMRGGPLAASLSVLLNYHGIHSSIDTLLAGLPLDNDQLTPSLFGRAAEKAGLVVRIVRTPLNKLNHILFPAVLILTENKSCVVFSIDKEKGTAQLSFPEMGMEKTELELT